MARTKTNKIQTAEEPPRAVRPTDEQIAAAKEILDSLRRSAAQEIEDLVKEAEEKLNRAERLADEHGLKFSFCPSSGDFSREYDGIRGYWTSSNC